MKILYLKPYHYPEELSSPYLGIQTQEAFAREGYKMELFTPTPSRGLDKETIKKYRKIRVEEKLNGLLTIRRFPLYAEGKNPMLRALRYFIQCVELFFIGVFNKHAKDADVIMVSSTPPIIGPTAALIKKVRHIPIVYNLQDIFPDSLVGSGMTRKGSLLWKIGRVIEDFTYRNCDKIIVISEDFKRNIMAKGVPEDKIEVIYNWVDENAVVPIAKDDNVLYDEFSLPKDKFYVVYAGNFGNAQNIDVIIRAAEQLKEHQDIQFLLFGTGGLLDDFKKLVSDLHLDNVRFFPLQPYNRVSYVYSLGSVGIVSCKKGIGKGAMPSKTWSIMSAGTPVVANYDTDTDLQRIITSHNLGVFSEADNVQELADAILYMYNNPSLCEEYGRNARRYVEENLTKDVGTSKYIEVVKSVVNK